jgi:hypothetical protein
VKNPTRLDFARWLTQPNNPLTARVTVNRSWQRFFGVGFVDTENDFGTQGSKPTHPELLDWLAAEFMGQKSEVGGRRSEIGKRRAGSVSDRSSRIRNPQSAIRNSNAWSMKALHRLIVTSATYRQSSHVRPELLARDPQNRLLARQSRLRLEAEVIRDTALAAAGLLSPKMLGPGVYPPQPKGIYVVTQTKKNWPESTGSDRFRRGMYTYFWRSSPYPFLPTFDAPDANTTCTRRSRSNTPLQALTLANDQSFLEMAQATALRILRESPQYDNGRVRHAFHVALSRDPKPAEEKALEQFLHSQRKRFAADAIAAKQAAPDSLPPGVKLSEAAAWTAVARVLMNLDEFITRE